MKSSLLAATSEPIEKDNAKRPRAMRVRAQDGRWRGYWFRFYFPIDETILPLGTVNYLLEPNDDPSAWGLREHGGPNY